MPLLQPCDKYVSGNYKRTFHSACFSWVRQNRKTIVLKVAFGELLKQAQDTLTENVILASWAKSGLWPLDEATLKSHPSILKVDHPSSASPPSGDQRSAAAVKDPLFGKNGQLRASGLDLTSPEVITALEHKAQAKELKEQKKRIRAEETNAKCSTPTSCETC
jgi:hypothetical protein